jgi:glycosyltransferase involved in cell wall biosynthesis
MFTFFFYASQLIIPKYGIKCNEATLVYSGSAGPVQRNELRGKACALLHPINFNEPFGLSFIESMACGTPVVAFSKGSMPEFIENGKNGPSRSFLSVPIQHCKLFALFAIL